MKQFIPCSNCQQGYIYSLDSVIKCECLKHYQSEILFQLRLEKAGIKDFNLTFDNYKGKDAAGNLIKLKKYCYNSLSTYRYNSHLYLTGINGTQKSTLAKIILFNCIDFGLTGKFILMNQLMDVICNPMADEQDREKISFLKTCDVLVIDDCFSAKKVTLYKNSRDYQMSFLDSFFRERLEVNKRNTIFTANVKIDEIEKNGFSYDIMNLLKREIQIRNGELVFSDVYVDNALDIDIHKLWD